MSNVDLTEKLVLFLCLTLLLRERDPADDGRSPVEKREWRIVCVDVVHEVDGGERIGGEERESCSAIVVQSFRERERERKREVFRFVFCFG